MDALSALREFVSSGRLQDVVTIGDRIQLGDKYSYHKSAITAYKSEQGKGPFYPLDAVVYWLHYEREHGQAKQGQYISSIKNRFARITGGDTKDLRDYLYGNTQSSKYVQEPEINVAGLPETQEEHELQVKRQKLDDAADGYSAEDEDQDGADILQHALATERKLRDRNSQLAVPNKSFARVRAICEQQLQQMSGALQRAQPPGSSAKPLPANLVKPSGRLEREVAPDLGLSGAAQLGIQVTSHQRPSASQPSATAAAQPSSSSRQAPAASQRSHAQPSTSGRPERQLPHQKSRQPHHKLSPIILVPPGETATITMWNAQAFLEHGQYNTVEASRHDKGAKGQAKEAKAKIHRSIGRNRPIRYEITDKAPTDKVTWDRVVALFCLGKPWQFKGYPKQLFPGCDNGDTVALFTNILGVYLHMSDEEIPGDVKKWNVKILRLNRHNRHTDMAEAGHFYSELDKFMNAHAKKAAGLAY